MLNAEPDACFRTCPICAYKGRFLLATYGTPPRWDADCPRCSSNERTRLMCLAFASLQVDTASRILHFAPERSLGSWLKRDYSQYCTADIRPGRADLMLDIEEIRLESNSIDIVLCSHVLEHVDDRKAIPELFRVLKPGGALLAMVPIVEGWERTYENVSIADPQERRFHFGRVDHLRWYGADLRERLRSAGFKLREYTAGGAEAVGYGLKRGEKVFICRKPPRFNAV